jgi:hypothetical protein
MRLPISKEIVVNLSSCFIMPQRPRPATPLPDDINFAAACHVAFAGFMRVEEFTYSRAETQREATFVATKLTRGDI